MFSDAFSRGSPRSFGFSDVSASDLSDHSTVSEDYENFVRALAMARGSEATLKLSAVELEQMFRAERKGSNGVQERRMLVFLLEIFLHSQD